MHMVFACHSALTAGAERSIAALVGAAVGRGHRATVVLPRSGPIEVVLRRTAPGAGIVYCRAQWWMGIDHRGVPGMLRLVQASVHTVGWLRLIRRLRPDLVIVGSTVAPAPMFASRLAMCRSAILVSESIRTNPTLSSVLPKNLIVAFIRRWATISIAVSEYVAAQFGSVVAIEPPDVSDQARPGFDAVDDGPPFRIDGLRTVMLGTLSEEKGQEEAVRAIGLLPELPQVTLDLYGDADGRSLERLRSLVNELGLDSRVRHRGTTDDPIRVLRSADVSIVCSRNEAYGRVTAESLMAGTPVIAYDLGGTSEILRSGGGVLVPPRPEEVAGALARFATDGSSYARAKEEAVEASRDRSRFGDASRTLTAIESLLAQDSTATPLSVGGAGSLTPIDRRSGGKTCGSR